MGEWTRSDKAKRYFYPQFPNTAEDLAAYFNSPGREYFMIVSDGVFVGII